MDMKEKKKKENHELVRELHYNKGLSITALANQFKKTERTIYRWLERLDGLKNREDMVKKKKCGRKSRYPPEIFERIIELKEEIPLRSAPMIHRRLKIEYKDSCPCLSTIQKFIRKKGLVSKPREQGQGYIKFQRSKPNDLWQVDIAGPQSVGHLKQLYLIAFIDDCSRFVVSAEYFRTQDAINVLTILKDAIISQGRPNQILADRGSQFWNALGELATRYFKLLNSLDVEPIYARARHPQTKGKIERWFRTVKQMFLVEARPLVKERPKHSLAEFNQKFKEWVEWYNTKKPHNSLPDRMPPNKVYFDVEKRIYRPLKVMINWDKWIHECEQRKVSKYNTISYKAQSFDIPPGHMRAKVDVIEHEDKLEIYYDNKLLIMHPYRVVTKLKERTLITRRIRKNGTISYKGKWYTIDYKLAGKTVEVQETDQGRNLLVYLNDKLIETLIL